MKHAKFCVFCVNSFAFFAWDFISALQNKFLPLYGFFVMFEKIILTFV